MTDVNPEGQGEEKFHVSTWLPECNVDSEPAVCELNPCGHFISIDTARNFAAQIRRGQRAANPNNCPMCRKQWTEIRCLSVEASINKIKKNLDNYINQHKYRYSVRYIFLFGHKTPLNHW